MITQHFQDQIKVPACVNSMLLGVEVVFQEVDYVFKNNVACREVTEAACVMVG